MGNQKRLPFLAACGVVCLTAANVAVAEEGAWMADAVTGCEIWSVEAPQADEGVTWSGACVENRASGQGSLVWWDHAGLAGTYFGDMQNGKVHGQGWLHMRDEQGAFLQYLGGFVDGQPVGQGIVTLATGERLFGELIDGPNHTRGVSIDANGLLVRGTFKDGKGVGRIIADDVAKDGSHYLGEAENGTRNGLGLFYEADDASTYAGQFKDGEMNGVGVLRRDGEGTYMGQFAEGRQTGFGTAIGPEGNIVQGQFENGVPVGILLVTETDGTQTVIDWNQEMSK